jgi:hypothetical protein
MKETYPLRLPRSLKPGAWNQHYNQFVVTAVAEKVSALETTRFFADRRARADFKAFDKIMKQRGGKPPREGDEVPE